MKNLILVRHGQSLWNLHNRFTGWFDCDLSENGYIEARKAGYLIKTLDLKLETFFTSYLVRAKKTLEIIINELGKSQVDYIEAWQLNEKHYGNLTGKNKENIKAKLGIKKVNDYRRSWNLAPPAINENDKYNPKSDKIYKNLNPKNIPSTESLENTYLRVVPYFIKNIQPKLAKNENVLISAHGNSLRALCKYLFKISDAKIRELEIPTGNPLLIKFSSNLKIFNYAYLDKSREKTININ